MFNLFSFCAVIAAYAIYTIIHAAFFTTHVVYRHIDHKSSLVQLWVYGVCRDEREAKMQAMIDEFEKPGIIDNTWVRIK